MTHLPGPDANLDGSPASGSPYAHIPSDQGPVAPGMPVFGAPGYPGVRGAADPDDMTLPLYGAPFGASVKRFFAGFVRFKGRASKSEYWWAQLFQMLVVLVVVGVSIVVMVAEAVALPAEEADRLSEDSEAMWEWMVGSGPIVVSFAVFIVVALALGIGNLALGWRRLQDANVRGAWTFATVALQVVACVPFASMLRDAWWIVIGVLPTKPEGQRFDP